MAVIFVNMLKKPIIKFAVICCRNYFRFSFIVSWHTENKRHEKKPMKKEQDLLSEKYGNNTEKCYNKQKYI